jgi:hypothetical protein
VEVPLRNEMVEHNAARYPTYLPKRPYKVPQIQALIAEHSISQGTWDEN